MGIGAVIGGALQGVGAGMMEQEKQRLIERRDAALNAARKEELQLRASLDDENAAKQTSRELDASLVRTNQQAAIQAGLASAGAKAKSAENAEQRQHEERMEKIRSDGRIQEIIARAKAEGRQVADTQYDETTGAVSVIFKDGTGTIVPNVIARRLPKASGAGSSLFDQGGSLSSPPANRPPLSSFER